MRVAYEFSEDWGESESLAVYLDDGREVGRYCVVDDPEKERASLERMIRACIDEAAGRPPLEVSG